MIYAPYTFEEVIQDVKSEIGLSNMTNLYPDIRQYISRAEHEIGLSEGFLLKKRMIFFKGNGNFDGRNVKLPADFISLSNRGLCEDGLCPGSYTVTDSHFVICTGGMRDKVAFTYFALNYDGNGNPIIPRNHKEAIVSFIVFKLYSQKVFNSEGSQTMRREYKQEWEDNCMAARGFDFFPGEKSFRNMNKISSQSVMQRLDSFCEDYNSLTDCDILLDKTIEERKIYAFQMNGPGKRILSEDMITDKVLKKVASYKKSDFINGKELSFPYVGRYVFVIEMSTPEQVQIFDILGNNIIEAMEWFYDFEMKRTIFVSRDYISPSTIYFRINYDE